MENEAAEFIAALFHAGTVTHFMHLSTDSYAKHKALGKFYPAIVDLADQYAEAYMGKYEQIKKFPTEFHSATNPVKYLEGLCKFVEESREALPEDTELQNKIDEIADLINSTLYRLRFLD